MKRQQSELLKVQVEMVIRSIERSVDLTMGDVLELRRTLTRAVFSAYRLGTASRGARHLSVPEIPACVAEK